LNKVKAERRKLKGIKALDQIDSGLFCNNAVGLLQKIASRYNKHVI